MENSFEIRVCQNPSCGLRYPLITGHPFGERCPACLGDTKKVFSRDLFPEMAELKKTPVTEIHLLLDNIRSAWNVGSIFRTADCFGVKRIYLCGITPTPENPSVKKTALGAVDFIPWSYSRNAVQTVENLLKAAPHVWALEQDHRSVLLEPIGVVFETPILLILGNEVTGVDPILLNLCEKIVQIPMLVENRSLNVEAALSACLAVFRS
ncbi:MAG: TrmH family RNA methyltransferase [Chloroflexota bacterium]